MSEHDRHDPAGSRTYWLGVPAVIGLLVIAVGWAVQGNTIDIHGAAHTFLPGLLANIGTALLLGVFFLLIQRSLSAQIRQVDATTQSVEQQVRDVRQEVADTVSRLDDLTGETAELLQATRDTDTAIADAVEQTASFDAVAQLLRRGRELGAISSYGPRVAMPHGERLRFRQVYEDGDESRPMIWVAQESPSGVDREIRAIWSAGEGFPAVMVGLAEEMKKRNAYPGDSVFDSTGLLRRLIETVSLGIGSREHARGDMQNLGPIIEIINPEWALTEDGLEHLSKPPYALRPNQLLEDEFLRESMLQKNWIKARSNLFEDAWELAGDYFKRRKKSRPLVSPGDE
jgi:hypothetical protein